MQDNKQETFNTTYGFIEFIKGIFNSIPQEILLFILCGLFILLIFIMFNQRKKIRINKIQRDILEKAIFKYDIAGGIDKAGFTILDIFKSLISAEGYYLYLSDEKSGQYMLKTVRHKEEIEANIAPSYSGLLSFKNEKYIPPLKLDSDTLPSTISIIKQGQIRLLAIPVGKIGCVHIAPVKHISSTEKDELAYACNVLESLLATTISLESLEGQVYTQNISTTAIHSLSITAHDFIGKCRMLIDLTKKMMGADGGEFLVKAEPGNEDLSNAGDSTGFGEIANAYDKINRILGNEEIQVLTRKDKDFYVMPERLIQQSAELVIIVNIPARENQGLAVFWYNEIPQGELHRFTGLQLMMKRLADLLDSHNKYKELEKSYLDMLKMMVETIDNLEPCTVGYSELMARYSGIIAREMNLDDKTIDDIILASKLSNIGVLGFSNELLFKAGKYTETEYEKMKLHAEVGASIVEATIPNHKVADYIRYHHERIDGFGYPTGLKGDDIPVGARIIAVTQTFLAKINGRRYREPLSFEKALDLIKSASGTQLDSTAVEALIHWFKKKQANPELKGAIGKCWDVRCVPSSICQGCPAYNSKERNCWEYEGVLCQMHGNTCRSCFVYTEYLYRMVPKV